MFLQSTSTAAMEKSMSALWQRYQLISTNIANEDTPGYKAKRLSFEGLLQSELNSIERKKLGKYASRQDAVAGINNLEPILYEETGTITRADGNNVDILAEQNELTKLQYQYQALAQRVNSYYSTLQYAITGR